MSMKKNEKAFLVNVMWVPLFAALMTVALSKAPGVNPYFVGALMGAIGAALCYWDYRVFMKKGSKDENEA